MESIFPSSSHSSDVMDLGVGDAGAVDREEPTDPYSVEFHVDPTGTGCAGMAGEAAPGITF